MSNIKIDVTESVDCFRKMIESSWDCIATLSKSDRTLSFLDDWLQANWERIVESSINPEFRMTIEPYGQGADCNIKSSRVWKPDMIPNSTVVICYIGNEVLVDAVSGGEIVGEHALDQFCSLQNGWPVISPPFDHVMLSGLDSVAVPIRDLRYFAVKMQ